MATGTPRIFWNEDEKAKIISKAVELVGEQGGLRGSWVSLLFSAQCCLPAVRRRHRLNSPQQAQWFVKGVEIKLREQVIERDRKAKEPPVPPIPPQYSPMVQALLDLTKAFKQELLNEVRAIVQEGLKEAARCPTPVVLKGDESIVIDRTITPLPDTPRRPKVLIVGGMNKDYQHLEKEFNDYLDLRFVTQVNGQDVVNMARTATYVIAWTRFISHELYNKVRAVRKQDIIMVTGGLTQFRSVLEDLATRPTH